MNRDTAICIGCLHAFHVYAKPLRECEKARKIVWQAKSKPNSLKDEAMVKGNVMFGFPLVSFNIFQLQYLQEI